MRDLDGEDDGGISAFLKPLSRELRVFFLSKAHNSCLAATVED